MTINFPNPFRRKGPPRNPLCYMLALEYLMWPGRRPHGLQKALAYSNGITPQTLNSTVNMIQRGVRARGRRG